MARLPTRAGFLARIDRLSRRMSPLEEVARVVGIEPSIFLRLYEQDSGVASAYDRGRAIGLSLLRSRQLQRALEGPARKWNRR